MVFLKTLFSSEGIDVIATKHINNPIPTSEDVQNFSKTNKYKTTTNHEILYVF
jgi:hypothetical protein